MRSNVSLTAHMSFKNIINFYLKTEILKQYTSIILLNISTLEINFYLIEMTINYKLIIIYYHNLMQRNPNTVKFNKHTKFKLNINVKKNENLLIRT